MRFSNPNTKLFGINLAGMPADQDNKSLLARLQSKCPLLTDSKKSRMKPTPYLFSGVLQTIYSTVFSLKRDRHSDIKYEREIKELRDGGTVSLDWYPPQDQTEEEHTRPIVIVMSGLGGSSYEYHIRCLVKHLGTKGFRAVVMNHRGTSRTPLTSPRIYDASSTEDLDDIVRCLGTRYPKAPLACVACSMGANVLTKYLGEQGENCQLRAGIAICCPFDLELTCRAMEADTFLNNKVFQPNLTATIKRYLNRHTDTILSGEVEYDWPAMRRARRMSEIDTVITAKTYSLQDCWEYYKTASSAPYVDNIRTPYLAINSLDDPVTRVEGIPVDKFKTNPFTLLALVKNGGHLGFFSGMRAKIWHLPRIAQFLEAVV